MNTIPTTVHLPPGTRLLLDGLANKTGMSVSKAGAVMLAQAFRSVAPPETRDTPAQPIKWRVYVICLIGMTAAGLTGIAIGAGL